MPHYPETKPRLACWRMGFHEEQSQQRPQKSEGPNKISNVAWLSLSWIRQEEALCPQPRPEESPDDPIHFLEKKKVYCSMPLRLYSVLQNLTEQHTAYIEHGQRGLALGVSANVAKWSCQFLLPLAVSTVCSASSTKFDIVYLFHFSHCGGVCIDCHIVALICIFFEAVKLRLSTFSHIFWPFEHFFLWIPSQDCCCIFCWVVFLLLIALKKLCVLDIGSL